MKDLYLDIAERVSTMYTKRYSTSFSMATRLFDQSIRQDIYNIYGFVRVADEIVDTYAGRDALAMLNEFEQQTYKDLGRGYSTNPVLHAFITTCKRVGITKKLIAPFIQSMLIDATPDMYKTSMYKKYIYGSAEVVGLMCLKVFVAGDEKQYARLERGAKALGSAYQKVNFLRDIADDHDRLGRYYFPIGSYDTFNEQTKKRVITDIQADFAIAQKAISQLPLTARQAVYTSFVYYSKLLVEIQKTPAETLRQQRVRVPDWKKVLLLIKVKVLAL